MKIVGFSDLHRDTRAAQIIVDCAHDADIVIRAGDFATHGQGANDTLKVLRALRCPFVIVHGNHDDPAALRSIAQDWTGAHYLHGDSVTLKGLTIFGMGGETPIQNDAVWNVGQSEAEAQELLTACPKDAILVSHTPPLGHCDVQADGSHQGSQALTTHIETRNPSHVLCGHIHEAWGMKSTIGASKISNLGPNPTVFLI
ncbi:serine/threonine protein phosphatase [Sulfitobacter sp. SK012]|uniref:metallophosphoesterase family protein n=1 Tax=Sulfitobacter sp. SK012 TaxID=1389005 RepID=UPI000E0AA044|nr:metallophosphoesterase family protein [Sulfitobacter sp. SK012]AXI48273.1 serine/threonine protein phosphatase [Sulfitobacter sp. SK012]